MNTNCDFLINAKYLDDPIDKAVPEYNNHPSILTITKFTQNSDSSFPIQHASKEKNTRIWNMLDSKKFVQSTDIPTKFLKKVWEISSEIFSMTI